MIKKIMFGVIIISLFAGTIPITESAEWENEYGKLLVWPDTSTELIRQKQFYSATWYKNANNLDIAFKFSQPLTYGQIYYWNGDEHIKVNTKHVTYQGNHYYIFENIHFNKDETKNGYWEYDIPPGTQGKWDMYIKLNSDSWQTALNTNRIIHLDPWWDSNWLAKKKITIESDQVPKTLTNFPVLINISGDTDLSANIGFNDGRDIAFVDSTETTQYNHEIEYFNTGAGGGATLRAWVNITSLSSSVDTELYMYFGNSGASNQSNPSETWDSGYQAVYHFEGTGWSSIDDSTANNEDVNNEGGNPQYNQDAMFGRGIDFDGSGDYLQIQDNFEMSFISGGNDDYCTFEAIIKKDTENECPIMSKYFSSSLREWFWRFNNDDEMRLLFYDETNNKQVACDSNAIFDGWRGYSYVASVYNKTGVATSDNYFIHYNKTLNVTGTGSTGEGYVVKRNTASHPRIAYSGNGGGKYLDGLIEELRISTVARSKHWIETTYNTIWNSTDGDFFTVGILEETSDISEPTNFVAETDSTDGSIDLSWVTGINATDTHIEYNTVSVWSRDTGTLLYNGTGTNVEFTSGSCGITYYFIGWSWNDTSKNWGDWNTSSNISCPDNPTNIVTIAYDTALNITWNNDIFATKTTLVRKSGSYPTSATDGTVLYNGTNEYYNDTGVTYGTHYYTLFSWNETIGRHSIGADVSIGSLRVNVYDENTSNAITNWDIFISNLAGDEVYESTSNNNTLNIDGAELPTGDVTITINQSDYETKIFSMEIDSDVIQTLNAYLARNKSTDQYFFFVVSPENEYGYEPPISNATVSFKRYINDVVGWGNVSIRKTSATGTVSVGLMPLQQYHITITKTGFNTLYEVFIPPIIEYAEDRYHTFRMISTRDAPYQYDYFWENIEFTATMVDAGYLQLGNITLSYTDSNTSTTNTQSKLFEVYNNTITEIDSHYQTSDTFTRTISNINTSKYHYVLLWFNNTATFVQTSPILLPIPKLYTYIRARAIDIETRITNAIGNSPIPQTTWMGVFGVVIPIALICLLGVFNTGVGIIGCGISLGFIQGLYAGYGIEFEPLLVALCPVAIVIGVIYLWATKEGVQIL
jgi:hypothetical protein